MYIHVELFILYATIHIVEMTNDKSCVDDSRVAINWKDETDESIEQIWNIVKINRNQG